MFEVNWIIKRSAGAIARRRGLCGDIGYTGETNFPSKQNYRPGIYDVRARSFVNLRSIELIDTATPAKHTPPPPSRSPMKNKPACFSLPPLPLTLPYFLSFYAAEKLFDSNSDSHRFCGRASLCTRDAIKRPAYAYATDPQPEYEIRNKSRHPILRRD